MALSTLDESTRTRAPHRCVLTAGVRVDTTRRAVLQWSPASVFWRDCVLAIMLVPLAVIVWRSCADFLSNKVSHSILYHPLEDWTQY